MFDERKIFKIAVFVSGRGSNLKAIINSKLLKDKMEILSVISDKVNCSAFTIAEEFNIPKYSLKQDADDKKLLDYLKRLNPDLIVLAGYLKYIPIEIIKKFANKIINIHPALLPSFGGKGMYGLNVHKAVFNASAKVSGASVHFVNENYDEGKIIYQKCVDISDCLSPEDIADKVLAIEHEILPFVINKFIENKIKIINNRVILEE